MSLSSLKTWGVVGFQHQTQVLWAPLLLQSLNTTRRKGKEY